MATSVPGQTSSFKQDLTISRQSIYEYSTEQYHELGAKLRLGERVFRYALNGAAELAPGYMTTGITVVANHANRAPGAAVTAGDMKILIALGATAATANQYAGGYVWVNAGVGIAGIYKIKSHLANAGSLNLTLNLYDPVALALTVASTKLTLYANSWKSVIIHPATTPTNRPSGVPLITIPATTATISYYGWLQTGGFCPVYCGATYTIGTGVGVDDTAGQVLTSTAEQWGVVTQIGSAGESPSLIWLTLDQ